MAHDELFRATIDKPILIMPAIESGDATNGCEGGNSSAFHFSADFPGSDSDPAPQLVAQIKDLVHRYVLEPRDPRWPSKWAQMYDRDGQKRYAINIIHVASNRLQPGQDKEFARGFCAVANRVFRDTRVQVGFTLDILAAARDVNIAPHVLNGEGKCFPDPQGVLPGSYVATTQDAGPDLWNCASVLAIQGFIPEFVLEPNKTDTPGYLSFKRDYLNGWMDQRIPVILDVSPGYDGHIVFGNNDPPRGFTQEWRDVTLNCAPRAPKALSSIRGTATRKATLQYRPLILKVAM